MTTKIMKAGVPERNAAAIAVNASAMFGGLAFASPTPAGVPGRLGW
jgi:hypothetical protein